MKILASPKIFILHYTTYGRIEGYCHGHTDPLYAEHDDEDMNTRDQELTVD